MFLILGILIVLFLITMRVAVEPARGITRPGEFDTINIRNEFSSVQRYTDANQTMLIENINDFSNFMKDRLDDRKIDLDIVYVNGFISENDLTKITITVGNHLGSAMTNINVSFGNASGSHGTYLISSLSSNQSNSTNVSFSIMDEEKHINVTYAAGGVSDTIFYTFTPKTGYTTETTFYGLTYTILDKITKDRFVQTDYL